MSDTVIKVENLSKLYRLGEAPLRFTSEGQVGTRLRYTPDGQAGTLSHDLNRWYAKTRDKEDFFTRAGRKLRSDFAGRNE